MLPDEILPEETSARIVCTSRKKYKKYIIKINDSFKVLEATFLDTRNPSLVSVNRISTLTNDEAHELGYNHQRKWQPQAHYFGFAQIFAYRCFNEGFEVIKDDVGGTQPLHANIEYPANDKSEGMLCAVKLAFHAEFFEYRVSQ